MDFDFDRDVQPLDGVYIYIAMSDDLQEWAFHHDRLHLLKIGYSVDPEYRLAYLNGRGLRGGEPVRPCLNFTDWRIIGKWPLPHYGSAKKTEMRLKDAFAQVFEPFDRNEIVPDYRVSNGETEIYRLPLRHLPVLPGFFHMHGLEGNIVSQAVVVVEKAVEEIQRQWAGRLRFLDPWDRDPREQPPRSALKDRYGEIIEQMQEDIEAESRARDGGWPYDDD
jgi:hypothetical protein